MMIGNNHRRLKLKKLYRTFIVSIQNAGIFAQKTARCAGFLK